MAESETVYIYLHVIVLISNVNMHKVPSLKYLVHIEKLPQT